MWQNACSITTTRTPSIVVIQGAYEQFCVPKETLTTYDYEQGAFGVLVTTAEQQTQTAFATEPPVDEWLKFKRLVAEWHSERGAMSSITESVLCPAYQRIIGMGATAMPFILAQLESEGNEPDQWFWALTAIVAADPVKDEDRGDYVKMAQSWLEWARNAGYAR